MANNYAINYEDERFQKVENAKETALSDLEKTYTDMIDKSDKYYQDQVTATEQWADKQAQLQQEQTDFAIQKIEQQKAQAQKDYTKEQSGAYQDWRKQSNEYGAEAEKMAAAGLQNTGFAESSQVSMYNAYQNRVAAARESYAKIVMDFNNGIREAQLQNNSALAEIQFQALQKKLELNLAGFQYKNTLLLEKADKKTNLDQIYYSRYHDVLAQINHENALAEQIRQYNESLAEQKRQHKASIAQQQAELAFEKQKYADQKAAASRTVRTTYNGRTYKSSGKESARENAESIIKSRNSGETVKKTSAKEYLNALIRSGASKDKVMNEINLARSRGEITKEEALELGNFFAPRGMQY